MKAEFDKKNIVRLSKLEKSEECLKRKVLLDYESWHFGT